ncbi:phasin family protein [Sediminitomix flava]|uniref:Uncharacterized protein n=1 Tax=Sediminitomix flava TaxID=379075 RepID=A0A315Z5R1_SEDFL|nr:phasin family protein [Sediminitomix flava]PWJ37906.1 hypothetical protein BC781_10841 [Sediminitomix flava]
MMNLAQRKQYIQDWITQQWVILFGKRIDKSEHKWLLGPFGKTNGIGHKFIDQLAKDECLVRSNHKKDNGLLESIEELNLSDEELKSLSDDVIDFYLNTSNYGLKLQVKWNPIFKLFSTIVSVLFSKRIEQLNIPTQNIKDSEGLTNEIIKLVDTKTKEVKRTIWLRSFKSSDQIVYAGVYETCTLPSGKTCIKAIFPLPNGNATVILTPKIGSNGELILDSSGQKLGDNGFYFLLKDSENQLWAKFIKSFTDKLVVRSQNGKITATQTMNLWNLKVLKFEYEINKLTH